MFALRGQSFTELEKLYKTTLTLLTKNSVLINIIRSKYFKKQMNLKNTSVIKITVNRRTP